jgi:hypothetical protein
MCGWNVNRHAYLDERRRALEMWEEHLLKILPAHDPGGSP